MRDRGDVSYRRKDNAWVVEQVLDTNRVPIGETFEEMIAWLQKESDYCKTEYLSGPCETKCDSIVPELKSQGLMNHPKFTATFKSIRVEERWSGDGYYMVIGVRDAIPEEIKALEEQESKQKADHEAHQRGEYERLRKVFESK